MRCPQVPPVTVAPPNRQRVHHDADCGVRAVGAARLVPSVVVALRMTSLGSNSRLLSASRDAAGTCGTVNRLRMSWLGGRDCLSEHAIRSDQRLAQPKCLSVLRCDGGWNLHFTGTAAYGALPELDRPASN
jgi:hypothetical protein